MSNFKLLILGLKPFYEILKETYPNIETIYLSKFSELNQFEPLYTGNFILVVSTEKLHTPEFKIITSLNLPIIFLSFKPSQSNLQNKNIKTINREILYFPIELKTFVEIIQILFSKFYILFKTKLSFGFYVLDLHAKILSYKNKSCLLTERETLLIKCLKENNMSKKDLLSKLWKYSSNAETHTFETCLYRLRNKIQNHLDVHDLILKDKFSYYLNY